MHPGILFADIGQFKEIGIETGFTQGVAEKRLMGSRGAGCHNHPIKSMIFDGRGQFAQRLPFIDRPGRIGEILAAEFSTLQRIVALDVTITIELVGGMAVDDVMGWHIDNATMDEIDAILNETVKDPVGPEFMAPTRTKAA